MTQSKNSDFRKLSMDQISGQFHTKIHELETSFLDTDDLLWEVNHKAYQDDPKIMNKVKDDLKNNFSSVRKKVTDISKLMKSYIDSDIITENVAVKFMKFMSKKHGKKHQTKGDLSLTEVLDFLDNQEKIRAMKKNETQVFKNAEMLNSFLLNKHFQFDNDETASSLYKKNKNSFEKTVKHAIGLSNFISSFGRIISSKITNNEDMNQIKATPRKTKDVPKKKAISFELYQIPTKGHKGLIPEVDSNALSQNEHRQLSKGTLAKLDTGVKHSKKQKKAKELAEDVDDMPSLEQLLAEHREKVLRDKKRFSHKKISYKISPEERLKKQTKIKVNVESPEQLVDVDNNGISHIKNNTSEHQEDNVMPIDSHLSDEDEHTQTIHDSADHSHLDSSHLDQSISHNENSHKLDMDSGEHESNSQSHQHLDEHSHDIDDHTEQLHADDLHIDKPTHVMDQEGVYDENDPIEVQELDKEQHRLKELESLGYPKVEKIDMEVKNPHNSYGVKTMSLTTSVKKFDGNPDAKNAYENLNQIMNQPFQEIKQQYQETKQEVHKTETHEVQMIDPEPSLNTARDVSLDDDRKMKKERRLRLRAKSNYPRFSRYNIPVPPRNLHQIDLNTVPFKTLKKDYSDKEMFRRNSFLPANELKSSHIAVPRNLRDNVMPSRRLHHKNLKQKTDELYANMLKMRF